MKIQLLTIITAAGLLHAAEKSTQPIIKAELDSIECHFGDNNNTTPPCTIRIHLLPDKGVSIAPQKEGDIPHAPLQCIDGEGNLMLGTFRGWEDCYDGSDDCHTIAYDFFSTPKGNSITADAHIPVPVKQKKEIKSPVTFSPTTQTSINVAGHELHIEPREASKEAKHASQIAFDIVYDHPSTPKLMKLCSASGETLRYRAIILDKKKAGINLGDHPRITYILQSDKKPLLLGISPAPITTIEHVPVRFRATIGTLEEKR